MAKRTPKPDTETPTLESLGGEVFARSFAEASSNTEEGPSHLVVVRLSSAQLAFLESRRRDMNLRLSLEVTGVAGNVDVNLPALIQSLVESYRQEARWSP